MKQHIIIATISMDSTILQSLLLSIEKYIKPVDFKIEIIVLMNSKNFTKCITTIFDTPIQYLPLKSNYSLKISEARSYLQKEVFNYCKKKDINPIVWILDEDKELDNRVNNYLPKLYKYRKKYDVIIGSIEGDSPNASFSGINVQLLDLTFNLNYLDELSENDIYLDHTIQNNLLRKKYPDYYYDLSSQHSAHLKEFFYIEPLDSNEKVFQVKDRIYENLNNILSGQNFFRPIKQVEKLTDYQDTLLRGGNTFILNIDVLKIENPTIRIEDYITRRSDMMWALINREFLRKKIVKTDFVVIHNRNFNIQKELNIQKIVEENSGSIIFNALKEYSDKKQKMAFDTLLDKQINKKKRMIENNVALLLENIQTLETLKKPQLEMFIGQLKSFYNQKNLETIIINVEKLKNHKESIFNQFISYKPLILDKCILETVNGNLIQYDIGNDNIKMITKLPIEDIDNTQPFIRIHSSCTNSEVFGAIDCDCASQLKEAMNLISKRDDGILFYITQEGRGHGYGKKISIVGNMQTKKINTYEACELLGIEKDVREYKEIANILKRLKINSVKIASNNPKKIKALKAYEIEVKIADEKLSTIYTHENIEYLQSKQSIGNHINLILNEDYLIKKYPYSNNKIEFYEKFDDYGGFSNFSDHPFILHDKYWRTAEHYYQAYKFRRNSEVFNKIQQSKTPMEAKNLAYFYEIDYKDNWENRKILFMHNALIEKFRQNEELKELLLETKESYIIEKAPTDEYWGSGKDGKGKNILGRLLMYVRDELSR
jgi:GTP cyclohydrolase II